MRQVIEPGTLFALPLGDERWGLGLVARVGRSGTMFAWFFDRLYGSRPTVEDAAQLTPKDAAFGDRLGCKSIRIGRWPIIGTMRQWDGTAWAMPQFVSRPAPGAVSVTEYSQEEPDERVSRRKADENAVVGLREDGLLGYVMPENILRKRFGIEDADMVTPVLNGAPDEPISSEYALVVEIDFHDAGSSEIESVRDQLEAELEGVLGSTGVGSLDGFEQGASDLTIYLDGDNGTDILAAVRPLFTQLGEGSSVRAKVKPHTGTLYFLSL